MKQSVWKTFLSLMNNNSCYREYLHEFTHILLVLKSFEKLNYILENYLDEILDDYHFYSFLDVFIYNLADVVICYKNNNLKRALVIFNNLKPNTLIYGSYSDFYTIFYSLVGYHLAHNQIEKSAYRLKYNSLVQTAKFNLFDDLYLDTYFD